MRLAHVVGFAIALVVLVPDGAAGVWFTLVSGAASIVLLVAIAREGVRLLATPVMLLGGYIFVVVLSTLAQQRFEELLPLARSAIPLALLALASSLIPIPDKTIILRWILGLAGLEALIAISQRHIGWPTAWGWLGNTSSPTSLGNNPITGEFGRSAGTMAHGIPLALLLATGIIILVTRLTRRRAVWAIPFFAALSYAIILSGSRSVIIVLAIVALITLLTKLRRPVLFTAVLLAACWMFLTVDVRTWTLFTSLDGSVSLTHRVDALGALGNLLNIGVLNSIFGNGWGANEALAGLGALQSTTFFAIDNGFVSLVATSGVLGTSLVLLMVSYGFRRSDATARAVVMLSVGMFFSFDVTLWTASFAPLVVLSCLASANNPRQRAVNLMDRSSLVGRSGSGVRGS